VQARDTGYEIKASKKRIGKLESAIETAEMNVEDLGKKVGTLSTKLASLNGDLAASSKVRTDEKAAFEKVEIDYEESLDAIDRAVQVIMQKTGDVSEPSLLQQKLQYVMDLHLKRDSATNKRVMALLNMGKQSLSSSKMDVDALVQEDSAEMNMNGSSSAQPQAVKKAYSDHSGGVTDMLKGLKDQFGKELIDIQT